MSIWDRSCRIRDLESKYDRLESLLNVQVALNMGHANVIIQLESHCCRLGEELLAAKRDIAFLCTENKRLRDDITPDDDYEGDWEDAWNDPEIPRFVWSVCCVKKKKGIK